MFSTTLRVATNCIVPAAHMNTSCVQNYSSSATKKKDPAMQQRKQEVCAPSDSYADAMSNFRRFCAMPLREDIDILPDNLACTWQALMARAQAPLKQVGFMMFMMWMSGNSIQIFSIMITISGLSAPIMAMLKCKEGAPTAQGWPE